LPYRLLDSGYSILFGGKNLPEATIQGWRSDRSDQPGFHLSVVYQVRAQGMSFENRVVGFIDVMGFKDLVLRAERGDKVASATLNNLLKELDAHVTLDNKSVKAPVSVVPNYIAMSDSIIVSVPEQYTDPDTARTYDGIAIVSAKVIQLTQTLLEGGRLVRGAIHVGPVRLENSTIFGSGYMEAAMSELIAWSPRVIFTPAACSAYDRIGNKYGALALKDGKDVILNVLEPAYSKAVQNGAYEEDVVKGYREHIEYNLKQLRNFSSAWVHWAWMAHFFNEALQRNSHYNVAPIVLPANWRHALRCRRAKHAPLTWYANREIAKMRPH